MKKRIFWVTISLSLLLTACGNTSVDSTVKQETTPKVECTPKVETTAKEDATSKEESTLDVKDEIETTSTTDSQVEQTDLEVKQPETYDYEYEYALIEVVGEEYLTGRALMRVEDQNILGDVCAVFRVGTNTEEKFTTEDWVAVAENGTVYSYDIVMDEWSKWGEKKDNTQDSVEMDRVEMDNCIYMLNEYLVEEYAVEYRDMQEEIKQAVFDNGHSADCPPAKLIAMNEDIPEGYALDPLARTYYPVYNFSNMDELLTHFKNYFTQSYMEEIEPTLYRKFLEFEGVLYLIRGGMAHGAVSLDFDSFDYSNVEVDNTVLVNQLLFSEPNGTLKLTFDITEGAVKISNVEEQ